MSVEACSTRTEIKLVVLVYFNESLISSRCEIEMNNEQPQVISLNTCIFLQKDINANYSIRCPICNDSQFNVYYSIPRSTLTGAADCSTAVPGKCL